MRKWCALLLWLMVCSACMSALAQTASEQACAPFAKIHIPEADRPTIEQAMSAGAPCSPFGLYYGSQAQDRFDKARWCGLAQMGVFRSGTDVARARTVQSAAANGATDPADLDQADGLTLLMLYANGEGVAHNPSVAQGFACRSGFQSPQGEYEKMPELLRLLAAGLGFDLCGKDQAPQGRSIWYACAGVELGKVEDDLKHAQKNAESATLPSYRSSLHALESAWSGLSAARAESFGANCDGGTGCGVFEEQDRLAMDQIWLAKLKLIASGTVPANLPAAERLSAADKELNRVYQAAVSLDEAGEDGRIEAKLPEDDQRAPLRQTERAWIRFRDAWVRYAAQRWPQVAGDRWRAWLTIEWFGVLQG